MEVKEEEEWKHVCKLCEKRFISGKSLGGHMRSHVIAQKLMKSSKAKKAPSIGDGDNDGGGYGLRGNLRKTWRVVDASFNEKQERVCKQCGKGFRSLKALCGHMSCHSGRSRRFPKAVDHYDNNDSWTNGEDQDDDDDGEGDDEGKEVVMESGSGNEADDDNEGSDGRSNRAREAARYKNLDVDSLSIANGSCSHSEIDQEQEELAMCLMMLSRDHFRQKGVIPTGNGVHFMGESSDNNSVILEGGSTSNNIVGITRSKDLRHGPNGLRDVQMRGWGSKKLKCLEIDSSDSGYFENGAKDLESDGSVAEFSKTYGFKKAEINRGSRVEALVQSQMKDYGNDRAQLSRNLLSEFDSPRLQESPYKKIKHDPLFLQGPKTFRRAGNYQCLICHAVFDTHQALGGHKMKYKAGGCDTQSKQENGELNIGKKKAGSKKIKGHRCPFCPKIFRSGQALGGHKRAHLMGAGAPLLEMANPDPPVKEKLPLLDLNLPAPVEDDQESNGHAQFMPW